MEKNSTKIISIVMLVVFFVLPTVMGQSPQKPMAEPVGEIVTSSGSVMINGASAQGGSTVFNGNEIQTGDASAFVNFTSGGGVLSIAPGSRVKISREQAKIIAEVLKGSVTVRSRLASTVIAPDRVVNSEPDNLYTVLVSDSGTLVNSLAKSVMVKAADGAVQTIAANVADKVVETIARQEPGADQAAQVPTPAKGLFISASCMKSGTTLMVSGCVVCNGAAVGAGFTVTLNLQCRNRTIITLTTTTDAGGCYKFTVVDACVPTGGAAHVVVRTNIRGCQTAGNRCFF